MSDSESSASFEQTVPLQLLLKRIVHHSYRELRELADRCSGSTDVERKRAIAEYTYRTRQHMLRLLVLVKWSAVLPRLSRVSDALEFLDTQNTCLTGAADSLYRTHNDILPRARAPQYDVVSALDVLSSGEFPRMPEAIKNVVPPPLPDRSTVVSTLQRLNVLIRERVVSLHCPSRLLLKIGDGRLFGRVPGEFEVELTLASPERDQPWRVLNLVITIHVGSGCPGGIGPSCAAMTPAQVGQLRALLQQELVASDQPLETTYTICHTFCTKLALQVLYAQADALVKDRWRDVAQIEEWVADKKLVVGYWPLLEEHPLVDISVGEDGHIAAHHYPNAVGTVKVVLTALDFKSILTKCAMANVRLRMEDLLVDSVDGVTMKKSAEGDAVFVECGDALPIAIRVDPRTGYFVIEKGQEWAEMLNHGCTMVHVAQCMRNKAALGGVIQACEQLGWEYFESMPGWKDTSLFMPLPRSRGYLAVSVEQSPTYRVVDLLPGDEIVCCASLSETSTEWNVTLPTMLKQATAWYLWFCLCKELKQLDLMAVNTSLSSEYPCSFSFQLPRRLLNTAVFGLDRIVHVSFDEDGMDMRVKVQWEDLGNTWVSMTYEALSLESNALVYHASYGDPHHAALFIRSMEAACHVSLLVRKSSIQPVHLALSQCTFVVNTHDEFSVCWSKERYDVQLHDPELHVLNTLCHHWLKSDPNQLDTMVKQLCSIIPLTRRITKFCTVHPRLVLESCKDGLLVILENALGVLLFVNDQGQVVVKDGVQYKRRLLRWWKETQTVTMDRCEALLNALNERMTGYLVMVATLTMTMLPGWQCKAVNENTVEISPSGAAGHHTTWFEVHQTPQGTAVLHVKNSGVAIPVPESKQIVEFWSKEIVGGTSALVIAVHSFLQMLQWNDPIRSELLGWMDLLSSVHLSPSPVHLAAEEGLGVVFQFQDLLVPLLFRWSSGNVLDVRIWSAAARELSMEASLRTKVLQVLQTLAQDTKDVQFEHIVRALEEVLV